MTADKPSPAQEAKTMVTDEMVEKACLAYWGDKNMNSMFKGKTREGVFASMRKGLEAALSTDAEPVAYGVFSKHGDFQFACVSKADAEKGEVWPGDSLRPLYAEPVKTAPAVAVKVNPLEWRQGYRDQNVDISQALTLGGLYQVRTLNGVVWLDNLGAQVVYPSVEEAKAAAQADYEARILSSLSAQVQDVAESHPDDLAVDRFALAMKAKLAQKRAEGRGGWDNPNECSVEWLSELLKRHVEKGDPTDVGNFAMMIHQRGGRIAR